MTLDDYIIIGVNVFLFTGGIMAGLIVLEFIYLTVRNRFIHAPSIDIIPRK